MRRGPLIAVDVSGLPAEATAVDVLARVALSLRRCGYELALRHASPELLELIELTGLSRTLHTGELTPDSTEPRC